MKPPAKVYLWHNGMVTATDDEGKLIPRLVGPAEQIAPKVLSAANPDTEFHTGHLALPPQKITREGWEDAVKSLQQYPPR